MLAEWGRINRSAYWLALFGAVLAAWVVLYAMAVPADMREASRIFGSEFWENFCNVTPDMAGFGRLVVMWALMSTAMMIPTAVSALAAYIDISSTGEHVRPTALVAGYMTVWIGFSIVAAGLQMALFQADLVSTFGDSRSNALSALLLLIAGLYQFTPMKEACLAKCRAPVSFFLQNWDLGAFRMGLRLGTDCVGCCWALMLLAFVGGVMSLAFMGLATLIMTLEKLPDIGRWISRPLGVALVFAALWVAALSL